MLDTIAKVVVLAITLFMRFFRKKDTAREVLSDTPVIDEVRKDAEQKAAEKFGKRTETTRR